MLKKKKKDKPEAESEEKKDEAAEKPEGGEGAAEGDAAAAGGDEDAAKKKKKKMIIIIGAVVMLLAIGGAGAFFAGLFGGKSHEGENATSLKKQESTVPVFFDLPQLLVNLNTGGKQASFIKATVVLQLSHQDDIAVVQANLPRLVDNYNTYLREMRSTDLYGSAGVYRLREEMLLRANKILEPVVVKDVLFKEILVQ